jgi:hypothetical protein
MKSLILTAIITILSPLNASAEVLTEVKFRCEDQDKSFSFVFERGWYTSRRGDQEFHSKVVVQDGHGNANVAGKIIDFHVGKGTSLAFKYSRGIEAGFYTTKNVFFIPVGQNFHGEITLGVSNEIVTVPLTCVTQSVPQW